MAIKATSPIFCGYWFRVTHWFNFFSTAGLQISCCGFVRCCDQMTTSSFKRAIILRDFEVFSFFCLWVVLVFPEFSGWLECTERIRMHIMAAEWCFVKHTDVGNKSGKNGGGSRLDIRSRARGNKEILQKRKMLQQEFISRLRNKRLWQRITCRPLLFFPIHWHVQLWQKAPSFSFLLACCSWAGFVQYKIGDGLMYQLSSIQDWRWPQELAFFNKRLEITSWAPRLKMDSCTCCLHCKIGLWEPSHRD